MTEKLSIDKKNEVHMLVQSEPGVEQEISECREFSNNYIEERLDSHLKFISTRIESGKEAKYKLSNHEGFCVSSQEVGIILNKISNIDSLKFGYEVFYEPLGR